jgi:hypothetical protein
VTVLTNEFVQTNNVSLNQNIDIEPAVLFRNMKKVYNIVNNIHKVCT